MNKSKFPFHVADVELEGFYVFRIVEHFEIEPILMTVSVCVDPQKQIILVLLAGCYKV